MTMQTKPFRFEPFSKKQRQVMNWWADASPVRDYEGIIADGAIRSGKTVSMSLAFVMWAMETFEGEQFGMAGKTIKTFRRNVLTPLTKMLTSRGYTYEDRRGDNQLTITRGDVSNTFYIFGGKDEGSQELVQGVTLAGFFFDEVALMPESFVNQATARCSVEGSKFWFNCNPEGPRHWFKSEWIDGRKRRGLLYLHFTMDDNLSLSERIKERYRSQYTGLFYERFILGRWAVAEGVIYDMFEPSVHVMTMKEAAKEITDTCYVSCDYGTQNATVFHLWAKTKTGGWICVREYYYSGREMRKQKTDAEYVQDLKDWLEDTIPRAIIVDPSAASFIEALRQAGFQVIKANNDVLDGIREMAKRLTQGQLRYVNTCERGIAEFGLYVWDKKAAARGEDAPVKDNDHAMDADRYFVKTILADKRARVGDKRKKGL